MSVVIGKIQETLTQFLSENTYSYTAVIVDKNTKKYCYPLIKKSLPSHTLIEVSCGEEYKNLDTCTIIWKALTQAEFDRHSLVINLGGGVIGDMGGFCAATYKRGIDFIQIPTTLLSQVDASVGGKLGIDFEGLKNHIGVFTQPKKVLVDPVFLQTLPVKEIRSGYAEVIKHSLIQDANKWNDLRILDLEDINFEEVIPHSIAIKSRVVEQDPTEKGLRKILNFGHTIGHAIETFYLNRNRLLHGEAIAIGMLCEAYIGYTRKMINEQELEQIEEYIYSIYGAVKIDENDFNEIVKLALQDKKNKGSKIRAALIKGIGDCAYDIEISKSDILKSLRYYCGI